jgi:type VI secretion system protein ImpK
MSDRDDERPSDRTVIRPNPGGRRSAAGEPGAARRSATASPPRRADGGTEGAGAPLGINGVAASPLVAAATPALLLATAVRGSPEPPDLQSLRERMVRDIQEFSSRTHDLSPKLARDANYALCATVDDMVLNTPWGGNSVWARQGMVGTFHREAIGGERFFDNLARLRNDVGRNREVLALVHACLSLGFLGTLRLQPSGLAEAVRIREEVYALIADRGRPLPELSPEWRGVHAPPSRLSMLVPGWVTASIVALVLVLVYLGLAFALNDRSDAVRAAVAALPPSGPVVMAHLRLPDPHVAAPPPPRPPTPVIRPVVIAAPQAPRITRFLEQEIVEGLVVVTETNDSVVVRLRNTGLFDSGLATVRPSILPTLERIAAALEGEAGRVSIIGHTDNQPIRTARFPSNWHLSVARAEAVRDILVRRLSLPSRISVTGRGESEPVDSNDTPDGRERNRRIDIVLLKGAAR